MEIKLIKDYKRSGKKTIKKGKTFYVTNNLGNKLIKNKIAKEVKDVLFSFLVKKVVPDGTKQTAPSA